MLEGMVDLVEITMLYNGYFKLTTRLRACYPTPTLTEIQGPHSSQGTHSSHGKPKFSQYWVQCEAEGNVGPTLQ